MSGANTSNLLTRRRFLTGLAALAIIPAACKRLRTDNITGGIVGANSARGHQLRTPRKPTMGKIAEQDVVIVGGGISGLSAAWHLHQQGKSFTLLELADEVGGNAAASANAVSAYPWGAHYLPIPDHRDTALQQFLTQCGIVTGYSTEGLPIYDEMALCFDPEERLWINGHWQDGLIPAKGVPPGDQAQITRFLRTMEHFRQAQGNDGKDAFCIPLEESSADETYVALDDITFAQYLAREGYTSPYLLWYLNYCTKDDYGTEVGEVSAWAGIHYFAARKGKAANAAYDTVLTWPEGNHYLVKQLMAPIKKQVVNGAVTYAVQPAADGRVNVHYLLHNQPHTLVARRVIMATPQFITRRICADAANAANLPQCNYGPWMVANLTVLRHFNQAHGQPLCWDNVLYGSKGLGYVNATHQHIEQAGTETVLTYYYPVTGADARKRTMETTYEQWVELVLTDLEKAHPDIRLLTKHVDVWLWGHGMVMPSPGAQRARRARPQVPASGNICFAHTDLSGISIFEEGFHQGRRAALWVTSA